MTGHQFKRLRERIDVDPFAMAAVLGVHVSTVYRWEATAKSLSMDPLSDKIVTALSERVGERRDAGFEAKVKRAVVNGLMKGGTLHALKDLLELLIG